MIIDFHTHVFPDKIAEKTIEYLSGKGGIMPFAKGNTASLLEKMDEAGVDKAVTLPVVTNPKQFESINRFALELNSLTGGKIISFGGIHPLCDDLEGKMRFLKNAGFKGVKIHPDYQGEFITHEGYIKILEAAKELDLIVVTHAGVDCGFIGEPIKCPPCLAKEVIKKVNHPKLVLAHLGACDMIDEVFDTLCGENVYFDTAYVLKRTSENDFKSSISRHGVDKILFASDSPWSDISGDINIIKSYGLTKETEEKILYKNAKALLSI
jgi:predicted TIM-barrel fold metal-dependent hydrolase